MSSHNRVILVGNLGRDPEIRSTQDGQRIATLSVATSESWRDRASGERKERTEWHRVAVWGDKIVDAIEKYLRKGSKVLIEGKLQTRKWQDQQGQDRYSTEVVVSGYGGLVRFLDGAESRGGGESGGGDYSQRRTSRSSSSRPAAREPGMDDDLNDEIPF